MITMIIISIIVIANTKVLFLELETVKVKCYTVTANKMRFLSYLLSSFTKNVEQTRSCDLVYLSSSPQGSCNWMTFFHNVDLSINLLGGIWIWICVTFVMLMQE